MLKLYNKEHVAVDALTDLKDYKIEYLLSGEDSVEFSLSVSDEKVHLVTEESYIRNKYNEYIVKAIDPGQEYKRFTCIINLENLKGKSIERFDTSNHNIDDTIRLAIAGTGWTLVDSNITKRRTVRLSNTNALDVLREIRKIFRIDYKFDSINKKIYVYESLGSDKGVYFSDELNLKSLNFPSDTYDYVTKIIPIGKDSLKIGSINNGKDYVENFQYTNKVLELIWEDSRYTDAYSLKTDAEAKLEEISKPKRSYQANIDDLAKRSKEYEFLDFSIGDTITLLSKSEKFRDKQRIVKYVEYPKEPWRNSCELGNTILTFEELQKENEAKNQVVENITSDNGTVDGSKVDEIKTEQIRDFDVEVGRVVNLEVINANINNLQAEKIDVNSFNAVVARVGTLETTKLNATELDVVTGRINTLESVKANIVDLNAVNSKVSVLESDSAYLKNALAGNLTAENFQAGAITAGSGVIANGAIGDAQIANVTAGKISSGQVDTNKVTVGDASGRLKIQGDTLQVIDQNSKERVVLGDVNKDGTIYGLRIRGADGNTVLMDETGVKKEGITPGAVTDEKVAVGISATKVVVNGTPLNSKITSIDYNITSQGQTISLHDTSITTLQGQITTKVSQTDYNTDKSATNGEITTLKTRMTTAEQDIDSITTTVQQHTSQISAKADNSTVTALSSKVTTVEQDLNGVKTTVSSHTSTLSNKADTTYVDGKVATVQSNINTVSSRVSTLDTNLNGITARVSSTESNISSVDSKVENIQFGGENLFRYGNFEGLDNDISKHPYVFSHANNTDGHLSKIVDIPATDTVPFKKALYMSNNDINNTVGVSQKVYEKGKSNAFKGKEITVSFWCKYKNIIQGNQSWRNLRLGELVSEYKKADETTFYQYPYTLQVYSGSNEVWTKYTKTIKLDHADGIELNGLYFKYLMEGCTGEVWITGIKHEMGNKVTDYSSHPDDIVSQATTESKSYIDIKTSEIKVTTDSINQTVSSVESNVSTKAEKSYVDGQIATTNTNVTNVTSRVATLETTSSSITARVSATETNISTVNNTVNNNKATWDRASNIGSDGKLPTSKLSGTVSDSQVASSTKWNTASTDATNAKTAIADMSSDGKVTPIEKVQLKKEWATISAEKTSYESLATTYGITTEKTNYVNAYNNLNTLLNGTTGILLSMATTSTVDATTFRNTFDDYYDKKALLIKKVNELSKSKADAAQSTANTANSTANTLRDTTVPALTTRVSTAEQKITPTAITNTVKTELVDKGGVNKVVTTIGQFDSNGLKVSNSNSDTYTQIDTESFSVNNNAGGTVAEFAKESLIPNLTSGTINADFVYANNIATKSAMSTSGGFVKIYYVQGNYGNDSNPGNGWGTSQALRTVQYVIDNLIPDVVNEHIQIKIGGSVNSWYFAGRVGRGVVEFRLEDDCVVNGGITLDSCTNKIRVLGNDTTKGTCKNGINILNCSQFDIGWVAFRGANWATNPSCNIYVSEGSRGTVRYCDFNGCNHAIVASNNCDVWIFYNRGSNISSYVGIGAYTRIWCKMTGADICPDYTGPIFSNFNNSHADLYNVFSGCTWSRTPSYGWSPSYTPTQKTSTWSFNKIWSDETLNGWSDRAELIQGYSSAYSTGRWTGYMQMTDGMAAVRSAISGGTNLSGRLYVQRRTSSGAGTGTVCAYGSDGTALPQVSCAQGSGVWITLNSTIISKIQSGAITYFYLKNDNNSVSTYMKMETLAKIEVTYTN